VHLKNFVLSIIIALFDIGKYANLLKMNIITFQKFISFSSSAPYLHAPLIIRCEVQPSVFGWKYEGAILPVLSGRLRNRYFRAWKRQ
jgi:hypothetical protein